MQESLQNKNRNRFSALFSNKKMILIFLAVAEMIVLAVGAFLTVRAQNVDHFYNETVMKENWRDEEARYVTPGETLPKGIYRISVEYRADADIETSLIFRSKSHKTAYYNSPVLRSFENTKSFSLWANDPLEEFHILLKSTSEEAPLFDIVSVRIVNAYNSALYKIACLFLSLLAIWILALFLVNYRLLSKHSAAYVGVLVIAFIASLPLFTRFMIVGHDLNFHLMRIEGLKDAFLMGDIPVKVQSNWSYGYGYAVSAMYGDITLILPALMRIIGFTLQASYKTFIFAMNLLTAITAFCCFDRMSGKRRNISLLATFLYTCAPYRLCCIYIRGAFGEFSGMLFLPLILLWMYGVYTDRPEDKKIKDKILLPVIGLSGIMQTHILTCVMFSVFAVIFVLAYWRKTFTRSNIIRFAKVGGYTLIVNLWFLIPFIRFFKEPLRVHTENGYNTDFQWYGVSIAELFAQHSSQSSGFNWAYLSNLGDRMSMPLGNGFVILLIVYFILLLNNIKVKKNKAVAITALIGILAAFMATNLFPYDFIEQHLKTVSGYITSVNVAYRYITMATVALSLFTVLFLRRYDKKIRKKYMSILIVTVALIASDQTFDFVYTMLYHCPATRYYDETSLNTNDLMGCEYLYEGTDHNRVMYEQKVSGENVNYLSVSRQANRFEVSDITAGNDAYIEFPIYYYPGYAAVTEDGKTLTVERGDNNRVKIILPDGFKGTIKVRYKEFALWRICEIISLLGFVILIIFALRGRKRNDRLSETIREAY